MTTNSRSPDTPEAWGAASRGYAERVAPFLMRPFAEELVARLDLTGNEAVLEVGAGSGALTDVLRARVRTLVATDYAPQMIEVLRERLERLGATSVRRAVMDGQALELEDASFDAAACSFALMLFSDRHRGFAELCRVVRPGGRVAVSGWAGPDRFEAFGMFLAAVNAAFPDLPPPPAPPPVFSLADPAEFGAQMERAGFRDVEVDHAARDMELPDFETLWLMLTAGAPPVQVLFDLIGPSGKERLRDELREIIEDRFGTGPIRMTNVATIGSGCAT